MAVSASDAAIIAGHLIDHAGAEVEADDTATVARWIRSRWGGSGTDANVISLYGEATRDADLVQWAQNIRLHAGSSDGEEASGDAFFASDGSTYPWLNGPMDAAHIYVSAMDTTWFAWEAIVSSSKVIRCTTYDHTNDEWTPEVTVGDGPLSGINVHGGPTLCRDSDGYVYCFWGAHNSVLKCASSYLPDDPLVWTALSDFSGTHTYHHPRLVGSSIYVFDQISPTDGDHRWTVTPCTFSAGVLTPGSRVTLLNFNDDASDTTGDWIFGGSHIVRGTEVHFVACHSDAAEPDDLRRHVYYFVYDTADGSVSSFDGGTTVTAGNLPISKSTADTSFRIFAHSGNDTGCESHLNFDTDDHPHVLYSVGTGGTKFTSQALKHIMHDGASWTAAADVGTLTAPYDRPAIVPRAAGVMDFYFVQDDGGQSNAQGRGGSIKRRQRSAAGVWGSTEIVLSPPRSGYALSQPTVIAAPHANARMAFTEISDDDATDGTLTMYAVGDGGFLRRPTIVHYSEAEAAAFVARMSVAPSVARAELYDELYYRLKTNVGLSNFDGIWVFAAHDEQAALLNLIAGGSDATEQGTCTFTADQGIAGNGSTGYIETGFNPSTGSPHWTQNSAHMGAYNRTTGSSTSPVFGINDAGSNVSQVVLNSSGGAANYRVNQGSNSVVTQSAITGFTAADRSASNAVKRYSNGLQQGTTQTTASSGIANSTLRLGRVNTSFNSKQWAAATIGGSLNDTKHLALWNALRAFLRNVGASA